MHFSFVMVAALAAAALAGCASDEETDLTPEPTPMPDPNVAQSANGTDLASYAFFELDPAMTHYWVWNTNATGEALFVDAAFTLDQEARCDVQTIGGYEVDGHGPVRVFWYDAPTAGGWVAGSFSKTVRAHAGPVDLDSVASPAPSGVSYSASGIGLTSPSLHFRLWVPPLANPGPDFMPSGHGNATAALLIACAAPFTLSDIKAGKEVSLWNEENASGGVSVAANPGLVGAGVSILDGFATTTSANSTLVAGDAFSRSHFVVDFDLPGGSDQWVYLPSAAGPSLGNEYEWTGGSGAVSGTITLIDPPAFDFLWIAVAGFEELESLWDWEAI